MAVTHGSGSGVLRFLLPNTIFSSQTVMLLAFLVCAYIVANSIYSLTLHPLAGIPGPKLCAITRIPYWLAYIRGNDVYWTYRLHNKYGPVLRFGPTDVSYTTAQAWRVIHGYGKEKVEYKKAPEWSVQPVNGVPSLLQANRDSHARIRRLFAPAFSDRALKKQEPLFRKYVDLLMSKLSVLQQKGEPLDMVRLYNFTTFDTMAQLTFGHALGLLEKNEFNPWVRAIFEMIKMLPFTTMIAYYPLLSTIFTRFEPKWVTEQRRAHCQFSADQVNQRLQEGSEHADIWNLVIAGQEAGNALSLEEMHSNADIFMFGGSETTATLLSGATFYLLSRYDQWKRLANEIRTRFEKKEDMTFDNLVECKYLTACLREALRLYPPIPSGSSRVIPKGGQQVLGKWIPQDTRVSVHHYSTYRSPMNFRDPEEFIPERWMGDPRYADDVHDAFQPFGWGPRNCIGQNMAMHEMRLILASLVLLFDLELCDESRNWMDQQTFVLWSKRSLMCRVTPVGA